MSDDTKDFIERVGTEVIPPHTNSPTVVNGDALPKINPYDVFAIIDKNACEFEEAKILATLTSHPGCKFPCAYIDGVLHVQYTLAEVETKEGEKMMQEMEEFSVRTKEETDD